MLLDLNKLPLEEIAAVVAEVYDFDLYRRWYECSYQCGRYEFFGDDEIGYEVAFGKNTGDAPVLFRARDARADTYLKIIGFPFCIGDVCQGELLLQFLGFRVEVFTNNSGEISSVEILNENLMEQNFPHYKQLCQFRELENVDQSGQVSSSFQGEWSYDAVATEENNPHRISYKPSAFNLPHRLIFKEDTLSKISFLANGRQVTNEYTFKVTKKYKNGNYQIQGVCDSGTVLISHKLYRHGEYLVLVRPNPVNPRNPRFVKGPLYIYLSKSE